MTNREYKLNTSNVQTVEVENRNIAQACITLLKTAFFCLKNNVYIIQQNLRRYAIRIISLYLDKDNSIFFYNSFKNMS